MEEDLIVAKADQHDQDLFGTRKRDFLRIAYSENRTPADYAFMSMFIIEYYETQVYVLKTAVPILHFLSYIRNLLAHGYDQQVQDFYKNKYFEYFLDYIQERKLAFPENYEKELTHITCTLSKDEMKGLTIQYCSSVQSTNSEIFYYYAARAFEQFLALNCMGSDSRREIQQLRDLIFHGHIRYTEEQFLRVKKGVDFVLSTFDEVSTPKKVVQGQRLRSVSDSADSARDKQNPRLRNIIAKYKKNYSLESQTEFGTLMQECIDWARTVSFPINTLSWKIVCKIIECNIKHVDADFYLLKQLRDEWLIVLDRNIDSMDLFLLYEFISPFFTVLRSSEIDPKIADKVLKKLMFVTSNNIVLSISLGVEFIKICRGREENLLEYMKLLLIHLKNFDIDKTLIILNEISIMSFELNEEFVLEIFGLLEDDSFLRRIKSETNQQLLLESLSLMVARVKSPTTRLKDSIEAIKRKLPKLRERKSEDIFFVMGDLYELAIKSFIANYEESMLDLKKMLNFTIEAKSFLEVLELYLEEINKGHIPLSPEKENLLIQDLIYVLDIFSKNETKFSGKHQIITNPRCFELISIFLERYKDKHSKIMNDKLIELFNASYFIYRKYLDSSFKYTVLNVYNLDENNTWCKFNSVLRFLSCFSNNENHEVQSKLKRIYGGIIGSIVTHEYDKFEHELTAILSIGLKFNAEQYDMRIVEKILRHIPNVSSPESAYSHLFALELILKKMNKGAEIERYKEKLLPLLKILGTDVPPGFDILEFLKQNRQYCIFKDNSGTSAEVSEDRSPRQASDQSREMVDLLPPRKDGTITRNYGPILVTALCRFWVGKVDVKNKRKAFKVTSAYVRENSDLYAAYLRMLNHFLYNWDELDVAEDPRMQYIITNTFKLISTKEQTNDFEKHITIRLQRVAIDTGYFNYSILVSTCLSHTDIRKACLLTGQRILAEVQDQAKDNFLALISTNNIILKGNYDLTFSLLETIFFINADDAQKSRYTKYLIEILETVQSQTESRRIDLWKRLNGTLHQLSRQKRINILGSTEYSRAALESFLSRFDKDDILKRSRVLNPAPAASAPAASAASASAAAVTTVAAAPSAPSAPAVVSAPIPNINALTKKLIKFIASVPNNGTAEHIRNKYSSLVDFFNNLKIFFSEGNRTYFANSSASQFRKFNIVTKSLEYLSTQLLNERKGQSDNFLPKELAKELAKTIQEVFPLTYESRFLSKDVLKYSAWNIVRVCQLTQTPVNIDVQKIFLKACIELLKNEGVNDDNRECFTAIIGIIFFKTDRVKSLESYQEFLKELESQPNYAAFRALIEQAKTRGEIIIPVTVPAPQVASAASAPAVVTAVVAAPNIDALTKKLIKFIASVPNNGTAEHIRNKYSSLVDFFNNLKICFSEGNRTYFANSSASQFHKFNIVTKSLQYLSTQLQNESRDQSDNFLPKELAKELAKTIQEVFPLTYESRFLSKDVLKYSAWNIVRVCQLTQTQVNTNVQKIFLTACIELLKNEGVNDDNRECFTAIIGIIFFKTDRVKSLESYQEFLKELESQPNYAAFRALIEQAKTRGEIIIPVTVPAPQVASAASARAGVSASVEMV